MSWRTPRTWYNQPRVSPIHYATQGLFRLALPSPSGVYSGMTIAIALFNPILASPNFEGGNWFLAFVLFAVPFCLGMLVWLAWWLIKRVQDLP